MLGVMRRQLGSGLAGLVSVVGVSANASAPQPRTIDWEEVLPPQERSRQIAPPVARHDFLGESAPAMKETGSFKVNPPLNGALLRVPGSSRC